MTTKTAITLILISCLIAVGCDTKTKNVDSCGDGFVGPGEQCDTDVGEHSCQSLGYYNALGQPRCNADCMWDLSLCGGRCGDGLVQDYKGEDCDGDHLNGQTCQSLGYTGGALACGAVCRFDTTGCAGRCGNGIVDEAEGELCDGAALAGETCQTLGYHGGELLCEADCRGYNLDNCVAEGRCGDGVIQATYRELCDGAALAGETCQTLGYHGGELLCTADCRFNFDNCAAVGHCGDGVIQATFGEICDGQNLAGHTCQGEGYYSGVLACGADCLQLDLSDCMAVGRCGDGVIQSSKGEACDSGTLGGATCASEGFYEGTLTCDTVCQLVTTGCFAQCGDGVIQTEHGEDCEGTDVGGQTCDGLGYTDRSGALACLPGCIFDESACVAMSANAELATLTLSSGALTPAFDASLSSYLVTVPLSVESVMVEATVDDPWATLAITPSQPMALEEGANPVTVLVTAEDGTQKVYSVSVWRLSSLDTLSPNVGPMLYVPAGTFQRDETWTNMSGVSAFRMSKYEITRAQWTAVTGWADPSHVTLSSGTSDPVQMVNWYHAIAFCNKLSLLEGLTPVYAVSGVNFSTLTYAQIPAANDAAWNAATANWSANGYRLPTEMEWMWAAMGADSENPGVVNTTGYAKTFAGSTGTNEVEDYAWFNSNSDYKTNPVGMKQANELGFHDLSGNVLEWVWDWYETYPTGTVIDYRGGSSAGWRLKHGGGWYFSAFYCALALRYTINRPYERETYIGFRVVRL